MDWRSNKPGRCDICEQPITLGQRYMNVKSGSNPSRRNPNPPRVMKHWRCIYGRRPSPSQKTWEQVGEPHKSVVGAT